MMRQITHLGGARVTILLPLVLMVVGGSRRLGLAMLIANALSHVAVQVLKRVVQRARPADTGGHALPLIEIPDPFSFPSGHAAAATALGVSAAIMHPWLAPGALVLAGVVAASRVLLRVHHLTDVLAGAALGAAGAILAARLVL